MVAEDSRAPDTVIRDESFWHEIQQAFTVDRSLVNLNNGGVSPAPAIVQQAMKAHLDYMNQAPSTRCGASCSHRPKVFVNDSRENSDHQLKK